MLAPGLGFVLAINRWGVLGGADGLDAVTAHPAYTVLLAADLFVFAAAVVAIGRSSLAGGARLAAGATLFAALAWLAEAMAPMLGAVSLDGGVLVAAIRAAVLAVTLALYAVARRPWPRSVATLLAAGAAANSVSLVVPPFAVVDFLVVPLAPILALAGGPPGVPGDAAGEVGVVNLADLYLVAVPMVATAWVVVAGVRGALRLPGRLATKQGRG